MWRQLNLPNTPVVVSITRQGSKGNGMSRQELISMLDAALAIGIDVEVKRSQTKNKFVPPDSKKGDVK
jgi:hypothetical protein